MGRILSVFFSNSRIYLAGMNGDNSLLTMNYVDSVQQSAFTSSRGEEEISECSSWLRGILDEIIGDISFVHVVLPMEQCGLSFVPYRQDITSVEIKMLLGLEIEQNFPGAALADFDYRLFPLTGKENSGQMMAAVLIPKSLIKYLSAVFEQVGLNIGNYSVSLFNGLGSIMFNYPEVRETIAAFISFDDNLAVYGQITQGSLAKLKLFQFQAGNTELNLKKISEEMDRSVNRVFLSGESLTKSIFMEASALLSENNIEVIRLNPFRMIKANLSEREKIYCSRTAHIFPACVGAFMPGFDNKLLFEL